MFELSEIFKGFQGEGPTTGRSALFIRFPYCNLQCTICDTKYSWKEGIIEIFKISKEDLYKQIDNCNRIVFTGGEPFLNIDIIKTIIEDYKHTKYYEIETNGTIIPSSEMFKLFDQYNVHLNISPKINVKQFVKLDTTPYLIDHVKEKYIVKFLAKNNKDMDFINTYVKNHNIQSENVWIQPIGITPEEMIKTIKQLETQILDNNYNVSARLHVLVFGDKKGK